MEKLSPGVLVRHQNGAVKLPPGFRFHPTDEELVVQYLARKAFSCPLPASIIPDIDLAKYNPWDLPGGCAKERYFFALREAKYLSGNRSNRATGCGYWKATGRDRVIVFSKLNKVVGMKKTLVFYQGKAPRGSRTDWIMHEYRLATHINNSTNSAEVPQRDWVLCRIFKKKRLEDMAEEYNNERQDTGYIDFMGERSNGSRCPSSPSNSDSSCVTENQDDSSNGYDISSSAS